MSPPRRKFVAGNWKMNGAAAQLDEVRALVQALRAEPAQARVALFPPATLLSRAAEVAAGSAVEIGAQDAHAEAFGAHTGDLSPELLKDAGATLVILGHSERRADHGETDAVVRAKVLGALRGGLEPVICVGETLAQREAGETLSVIDGQLAGSLPPELAGEAFSVAYEPVWAIGTGLTPTVAQVEEVHAAIRRFLDAGFAASNAGILYGGSVKPSNAAELMAAQGVDGALVGGASLKASDFLPIIRAAG
jgi:triosephosphate isomerase